MNKSVAHLFADKEGYKIVFLNYLSDPIQLKLWLNYQDNAEARLYTTKINTEGWHINNVEKVIKFLTDRSFDIYYNNQKIDPQKESPDLIPYEKRIKVYSKEEILQKRMYIHNAMIKNGLEGNFRTFNNLDLEKLFELYDQIFFKENISKKLKEKGDTIQFIAEKSKDTPIYYGYCDTLKRNCIYNLYFSVRKFTKMFQKGEKLLRAGGINCWDRLSCLQITFEHELMHLIFLIYKIDVTDEHGPLFQCMMDAFYDQNGLHAKYDYGDVSGKLSRDEAYVGLDVQFYDNKGVLIKGKITKLLRDSARVQEINSTREWFGVRYMIMEAIKF